MRGTARWVALGCLLACGAGAAKAEEVFSAARAMAHVRALSETIGARKTGTPGEAQARDYIAAEMGRLGLEVRRLPVGRVASSIVGSENIIGVLKGRIPDTILIGAHHDTRATSVPGANDDASAVGVMLEAARVLAAAPPAATVIFASFCAEEEGLLGATHYAQTQDLSSVRVVIVMDPVGQREIFISPFPAAPALWASRALAAAARRGAIDGVMFDPLYLLVTRSILIPFGADHEPFMDKAVPAFSLSDRFRVWTYHTTEDQPRWIDAGTLASAGKAILSLVELFDQDPGAARAGRDDATYVVVPLPGRPVFVVTLAIYVLAATLAVLAALWWRSRWWRMRRRGHRLTADDAWRALARAGIPLACAILGALISEGLTQAVTGYRFGWWSRQTAHIAQAAAWSLAGLAAGWRLASKRRAPDEPEIYTALSVGLAGALGIIPLAAGRPDIGFYFLLPAAMTLLAALVRPALAGVGALIGSLPMLALVTPRGYADAVAFVNLSAPAWVSAPALLVLGLPLALALARSAGAPAAGRAPRYIMGSAALAGAALLLVNAIAPAYDAMHRRIVRAIETVDLNAPPDSRASLRLASAEYLRGVRTNLPGRGVLDRRVTTQVLPVALPETIGEDAVPIVSVEAAESADREHVRDVRVVVLPPAMVDRARITLRSAEPLEVLDEGIWISRSEFVRRHVHADDAPSETFRISGRSGQTVEVEVRLDFTEDILGLQVTADQAVVQWSATIAWRGEVQL